jgi:phage pi2 protein 07
MNSYWLSIFPEDLFPPREDLALDYRDRVNFGFLQMTQSSISVGFICRNTEPVLPYTIARVEKICSFFNTSYIYCYENDSIDNSNKILKTWASRNQKVSFDSESLGYKFHKSNRSKDRTDKMAYYRNKLKQKIERGPKTDYTILLDADILGGFSYEGLANSFSYPWDICAANSIIYHKDSYNNLVRLYYDSWAFREIGAKKEHRDEDINILLFNRSEAPVSLDSAFGGLCIYNNKYYQDPKYRYSGEDCEHISLHSHMKKDGARLVMNPSQIALYSSTRFYHEAVNYPTL